MYWVFGEPELDEALKEWTESRPPGCHPEACQVEAELVKQFLLSEPVKKRDMIRHLGTVRT